jgi:hypothetical protein
MGLSWTIKESRIKEDQMVDHVVIDANGLID